MSKDEPAPTADENAVADDKQEPTTAPELSQAEQDALLAASDGVDGVLTENTPVEEDNGSTAESKDESDSTESESDDKSEVDSEEESVSDDSQDDDAESDDADEASVSESEPAPELETEKDEEGIYNQPTASDPGDFKPGDYSFEVKTTDGKTHKITSPEEVDVLTAKLDDNPDLMSASQYTLLNRKAAVMDQGIAADKRQYEANKEQFDKEQANAETRENTLKQWNSEINYLAKSGELPKISEELDKADWTDPKIAKEPAVKARLEVFKWMEGENNKRLEAGLEPIKSVIDAHNAMQLENLRQRSKDDVSREKTARQKKGSMVGGSTAFTPSNAPANSIVGTGGSLDDLITEYYNQ